MMFLGRDPEDSVPEKLPTFTEIKAIVYKGFC